MPNDLESHRQWTRDEWDHNEYMVSIFEFLKNHKIKTAVDAGGCTGEFTNILLERVPTVEKVIILEPIVKNYDFIINNVIDPKVDIINKALYETEERINLGRIDNNVGGWSINWSGESTTVECISIEKLLAIMPIDFMKIDIEGAERDVLSHSSSLHEIQFLEIEFHDHLLEEVQWRLFSEQTLRSHEILFSFKQNAFFSRR